MLAAAASWRATHLVGEGDLRTVAVLAIDTALGAAVAIGHAIRSRSVRLPAAWLWSITYGAWAAASFRLVPPVLNEEALYYRNLASLDIPYGLLGAVVHGGIVAVLTFPLARRVLFPGRTASLVEDEEIWPCPFMTVVLFFIVATAARLLVEVRP